MAALRLLTVIAFCLAAPGIASGSGAQAPGPSSRTTDMPVFHLFLTDGSSVPTYGEFARVGDDVVFSMPLGTSTPPRLQLITLRADSVDWPRTDRYVNSVRYQRYAATRGEADFAVMAAEVAAVLNEIALTTEPSKALEIADRARRMLMAWPGEHFGYRQEDIRDILGLIDEAAAPLDPQSGGGSLRLSFVAMAPAPPLEPVLAMPTPRDQVARLVTLVSGISRAADRIALLRAALSVLEDAASEIPADDVGAVRRSLEAQLRDETSTDERYARLSRRLIADAQRAAENAQVRGVERVFEEVEREDARLGGKRPETMQSLRAELDAQLHAARDLRLRRDQWTVRRQVYRDYVESVSAQMVQLVKARASLDEIRRLAGPAPKQVLALKGVLSGGAERLQSIAVPDRLRSAHEQLVTAWRFAESAVGTRHTAITSGDLATAWQASSAAAGSLMMLARAQEEIRKSLEYPQLR